MAQAAAGGAIGFIGGYMGVQNAQYENAIYEANAKSLEQQAQRAIEKGNEDEQSFRNQVALMQSNQRVSMAAAGIDIGSGTAAAIQEETIAMGNKDAMRIKNNAFLEATGFRNEATNQRRIGNAKVLNAQTQMWTSMASGGMQGFAASGGSWGGGSSGTTSSMGSSQGMARNTVGQYRTMG